MKERSLTDQMREYLSALYWRGNTKGCGFGPGYDSTRKALVKRGLVTRHVERRGKTERAVFVLTDSGIEAAKALPDPRDNGSGPLLARLEDVRAGRW